MEYLHPNKKTTHAKEQGENRKINAETNSHGNKLSTQTNAFHQLFHQWRQPRTWATQQLKQTITTTHVLNLQRTPLCAESQEKREQADRQHAYIRDDRIVDFYYPILSCFWNMISLSDPNPLQVEIILSVSENYPKVYCDAQHTFFVLCLFSLMRQNNCWNYSAFGWTRLVEVVTWQVWNVCPA